MDQKLGFKLPWTIFVMSAVLLLSIVAFHLRWSRPVSSSPIQLPQTSYIFRKHHDLMAFDENTQKSWSSIIEPKWWDMSWTDSSGQIVTRGLDMFHKLHCLIALREEFTALVLDPDHHLRFEAQDRDSVDARLHLGHCFDFLRQVSQGCETVPYFKSVWTWLTQGYKHRVFYVLQTQLLSPSDPSTQRRMEQGSYTNAETGVCLCTRHFEELASRIVRYFWTCHKVALFLK